ncbi:unnamed protein product, partial [Ectocarpus sp. 12 AP-2014]
VPLEKHRSQLPGEVTSHGCLNYNITIFEPCRNNDVGHEEGDCSRPILRRMRRSCSECGRRKKSCDGQRPCG